MDRVQITNELTGEQFFVMFNPEEYSLNKDNNFASQAVPGLSSPILQFVHGNLRTLDMELFFDTSDERTDVRLQTNRITDLLKIDSNLHAPPLLHVDWGSLHFPCVLAKASQKFLRFLPSGLPSRARVTVTFNEYLDAETQVAEANLQTADFTKVHVTKAGDTLWSLAGQFYEDALKWRPIALMNRIVDPRSITPGQELRIPSLPFVDPNSGEVVQ
ncbi:LysM repeat protein [Bradyrhizobium sp. USDA 4354]